MWLITIVSILGYGLTGFLPKNIPFQLRILLSGTLGLFVFTTINLYLSFILGINLYSILISLSILAIISILSFYKYRPEIKLAKLTTIFNFVLVIVVGSLAFIWFTQALAISSEGFKTGGGGMYGDSALHAAYTSRLETGKLPIQNPLFAGKILVYPVANDLLSAIAKIAGLNFNLAFAIPQILFLIGFFILFYQVVKKFTSDVGFVIAILLLFLGSGVGFFYFFSEWQMSGVGPWQFLTTDYTNNPHYNLYFHNLLTGLVLPERSFLPGLTLGLLIFLNFFEYFQDKKIRYLLINGVILGTLPFWHTHTFIYCILATLIFSIWLLAFDFRKTIVGIFLMLGVSFIVSIPFLLLFITNHSLGSFIHTTVGWKTGPENIFLFWFKNSFLTIPLAILGFLLIKKSHRILFIPAFAVFLIANLVIFQPWDWDNIKLLSWSFLFFAILAGVYLAKIFHKGILGKTFVTIVVIFSILSGLLSISLQLKNKYIIYDGYDIELADWAKTSTAINDIFIIETNPNHPIPGLAGRLVYTGYPGHLWVHGIDYAMRESQNNQILAGDFRRISDLEVPISYVVLPKQRSNFANQSNFQAIFQNQKYLVLKKIKS